MTDKPECTKQLCIICGEPMPLEHCGLWMFQPNGNTMGCHMSCEGKLNHRLGKDAFLLTQKVEAMMREWGSWGDGIPEEFWDIYKHIRKLNGKETPDVEPF